MSSVSDTDAKGRDAAELVFLCGAPRSGTTWLQLLIAQHAQVWTVNETHLFGGYLSGTFNTWNSLQTAQRAIGLHHHMTELEFLACIRSFADGVIDRLRRNTNGQGLLFLEKTPAHVRQWAAIARVYPEARFLHMVRDPRAVVASMSRAGKGWGSRWASPGVVANARQWAIDVGHGLEAEASLRDRCRRVSYEKLWAAPVAELGECLAWLGLNVSQNELKCWVEQCRPETMRTANGTAKPWNVRKEPEGFFGKGGVDGWQQELTGRQVRAIEWICREGMEALGYQGVDATRRRKPLSVLWDQRLAWAEWKAGRLRQRI